LNKLDHRYNLIFLSETTPDYAPGPPGILPLVASPRRFRIIR
jgi:hypothetical protein